MGFAQQLTRFACGEPRSLKTTQNLINSNLPVDTGAHDRNRTGDLVLTKDVLYRLSYVGKILTETSTQAGAGSGNRTHVISLEG